MSRSFVIQFENKKPVTGNINDDVLNAHTHSSNNRADLLLSEQCGCFHCVAVYNPSEITEWVDKCDGEGVTAVCPECGIDSVLASRSGYPLVSEFLLQMHDYWFSTFKSLSK